MHDADRTPTESPISLAVARIETKLDDLRADISLIRMRTDKALEAAFSAHQMARTAVAMRSSWLPYLISGLALLVAAWRLGRG